MSSAASSALILTVGNELLKGSVLNTNARFLGRRLTALGFEVTRQVSCPDSIAEIHRILRSHLPECSLVIMSGGLGPTPDDLTRDALASFFSMPLELSKRQWDFIRGYYKKRGKSAPELVKKEALFPRGAVPLFNRYGIALGFYIKTGSKMIVVLPGVPYELENMFVKLVMPVIKKEFRTLPARHAVIARMAGISEPEVMQKLGKDFFDDPFEFGIYPAPGEVTLRLYAATALIAARLRRKIARRLDNYLYAWEEKTLSEIVGGLLASRRKTVAVAESCTGGLCSAEIARVAGASRYFRGGIAVYHKDVKRKIGVTDAALENGEVSAQVARELARAARSYLKADYGIGITGIAGPSGAAPKKPVGLVYISISGPQRTDVYEQHFWGEREQVQAKAVKKALEHLHRALRKSR